MPYADGQCGSTCFDDFRLLSRLTVGVVRHVASDRCAWTRHSEVCRIRAVRLPSSALAADTAKRSLCHSETRSFCLWKSQRAATRVRIEAIDSTRNNPGLGIITLVLLRRGACALSHLRNNAR